MSGLVGSAMDEGGAKSGQEMYRSPRDAAEAIVREAVVEQRGHPPFAVAAVLRTVDADGRPALRFEAVRREPFDVVVDSWRLDRHSGVDEDGALWFSARTRNGDLAIRGLRQCDASWLSDSGLSSLPVDGLTSLVRTLHEVEAEQDGDSWMPFDVLGDGAIEFLLAFVSERTGGVFGLAYKADMTDTQEYYRDVMLLWRAGDHWQLTCPVGTDRWQHDAPSSGGIQAGHGDAWRTLLIHPACAERFLRAFDSGQWISADSAYAASLGPDGDCDIDDFSPRLAERFAARPHDEVDDQDELLKAFIDGRAMLLGDDVLHDLLALDASTSSVAHGSPASGEWLCMMHLDGEPDDWGDGITWRADIVRTGGPASHDHWWPVTPQERVDPRMLVFHDDAGRVCRVAIEASGPIDQALDELGLDFQALGSPTLFGAPIRGWTWRFSDVDDPFPFRPFEEGGPR